MSTAAIDAGGGRRVAPDGPRLINSLLHRSLDVVELLLSDVLEPTALLDPAADQVKEAAEAGMLLRLTARLDDPALRQRSRDLAHRLAPLARSEQLTRRIAFRPSSAAPLALAHACLSDAGLADAGFEAAVRAAFASPVANAGDRTAYRILDVAWIRHLVLGDAELVDHPVLPVTCLGTGIDLVAPSISEAYAFSHTLPYATDFGRLPLPAWVDRARLSQTADALIAKALTEDDLDLLGELLMAPTLLRTAWTPTQEYGWRVLLGVWERHPILPGPGLPPAVDGESALERRRRVLGTAYHTSLVGGLLLATTLSRGQAPSGSGMSVALDAGGPTWRSVWAGLSEPERTRYAVVPELVALHRAVTAIDLPAIHEVLGRPGAAALPEAMVEQCLGLLRRVCALG